MDKEELAFSYLEAIIGTGLGVRVMPVGVVAMWLAPWNKVPQVFMSALKVRFINVVCVPAGITMGAAISVAQFGNESASQEQVAYEPPTAIHGLYTVGIPNVIIMSGEEELKPKDIEVLKLYSAVICPTSKGSKALGRRGVPAVTIPPESDQLSRLFSGMNPAS
jgi:hypothetical protein